MKREKKAIFIQEQSQSDDSNYSNGRWTDEEHYLFLVAVKQHGKDWKLIEQVVKTRSSTQARSHAQKVLNDELYSNLDEEIKKFEGILKKAGKKSLEKEKSPLMKSKLEIPNRGSNKREKKEERKVWERNSDIHEKVYSARSIEDLNKNKDEDSSDSEQMDYDSDYSCPEDPNTKLFAIERVIKKKPNRGKKRAKVTTAPTEINNGENRKRKDNIAIQSIASTTNSSSPAKTLPQNIVSFKETNENPSNHIESKNLKENDKVVPNIENGWKQQLTEEDNLSFGHDSKLKLKPKGRGKAKAKNLSIQEIKDEEPQTLKINDNIKVETTQLLNGIQNSEYWKNIQPLIEEFNTNTFDWFFSFNICQNKIERKMTRDEPKLHINCLDSNLILGDEMYPLFNLY